VADLHVFHDGEDWYVAQSLADAEELRDAHYGEARPTEMRQLPDDKMIGILCDEQGQPSDGGKGDEGVDLTAAQWATRQGRGYLCSRDF